MNNSILCDKRYPIEQPDDFIGREEIIWQIKDKVFSGRRNCIAIIADDGMGKSSLINYIYFEETQKNLIDNYEKNLLVLLNNAEPSSFEDFFFILHEAIYENIQLSSFLSDEIKEESQEIFSGDKGVLNAKTIFELKNLLNRLFLYLYKQEITTTILIDDIDKMTKAIGDRDKTNEKRQVAKESFKYLRSKVNDVRKCDIRYIITSKKPLKSISKECYESGFPGIFEYKTLEPFTENEIEQYLSKCNMDPEDSKYSVIRRISGGFPGILRSACKVMGEIEKEHGESSENKNISQDEFYKKVALDAANTLESQWNVSSDNEKLLYKAIAENKDYEMINSGNRDWSVELDIAINRKIIDTERLFTSEIFGYFVKHMAIITEDEPDEFKAISEDKNIIEEEKASEVQNINAAMLEQQNDILAKSNMMKDDAINMHKKTLDMLYEQNKRLFSEFVSKDSKIKSYNSTVLNRESKKEYNEYVKDVFQKYMAMNISETDGFASLSGRLTENAREVIGDENHRMLTEAELLFNVYRETDNDQSPVGVLYGKLLESLINKVALPKIKSIPLIQSSDIVLTKDGQTRLLIEWDSIYIGNLRYVMNQCRNIFEQDNYLRNKFRGIYTFDFRNKLEDIRNIRNKCDHEKKEPGDKVTVEDIEVMRDSLFGINTYDTGIIEAMVKLYNM